MRARPEYDLASLLYDPYVRLSGRAEGCRIHRIEARVTDPDFAEKFQLCAMQRLMQALGAYAFLGLVQKNRAFLAHIPAALDSLAEVLTGIEGSELLRRLLRQLPHDRHGIGALLL
jgi:aminoglycoside/choline kinase family phosphotransferase